jgi:hypothetical protein
MYIDKIMEYGKMNYNRRLFMKFKYGFLVIFVTCILLFTTCDFLNGDNNSENNNEGNNNGNDTPAVIVEPMTKTKWGQGSPFNSMLPMDGDTRSITGCGVIATAQIMKFHRHPERGSGWSEQYTIRTGIQEPVNLDVAYDWNNMLNTYTNSANEQQRNAVATLAFHIGVAWKRDFIASSYSSRNLPVVLTTFFGYDRSIQRLDRLYYDDTAWETMIKQQLDAGLPVLYRGYHPGSDHSFVVDGYDNAGRFHINWGWSGSNDGWYSLNNLNPRGNRSWYNDQYIVINIKPDAGGLSTGYKMALDKFTVDKTSVPKNEVFYVTVTLRNISIFDAFSGGEYGAALVNDNGDIVEVIGTNNGSISATNRLPDRTITCYVPENVDTGEYNLRIVTRVGGGDWKIVSLSAVGDGVQNSIDFTVTSPESVTPTGGYGQLLRVFTSDRLTAAHNETTQFTVTLRMRNTTSATFSNGQYAVALLDNAGNIISILGTGSSGSLNAGSQHGSTRDINCTISPNTVTPGQYNLRILVKPADDDWRIATLAEDGVPTSYEFTVQ